jgi:hypothetical protein
MKGGTQKMYCFFRTVDLEMIPEKKGGSRSRYRGYEEEGGG